MNADAKMAEETLKKFRERPHTTEEAETEADRACRLVIQAASEGTSSLREAISLSYATINRITDSACGAVQDAARAAEKRRTQVHARALARLDELIALNRTPAK